MSSAGSSVFATVRPLVALRHPGYRLFTAGTAPGMIAMQMGTVALGYLAYTLSGSATALGVIGLGWGVPMLGLSLVGGVVADRVARRRADGRLLVGAHARQFVMLGVLGGFTTFSSFSLQTLNLLHAGEWGRALANVGASVVLCLVAVWLGHVAAVVINR